MTTNGYIRAVVTVIAVMLTVVVFKSALEPKMNILAQGKTALSTGVTAWEYKWLYRQRTFKLGELGEPTKEPNEWVYDEDGKYLEGDVNLLKKLNELGAQGWELVAIEARSDHAVTNLRGRTATCVGNFCNDTAILSGTAGNGATSSDVWLFKRQKR